MRTSLRIVSFLVGFQGLGLKGKVSSEISSRPTSTSCTGKFKRVDMAKLFNYYYTVSKPSPSGSVLARLHHKQLNAPKSYMLSQKCLIGFKFCSKPRQCRTR